MASPFAEMTDWLDWQRPYRFGVLLALPPGPVRKEINELRAKYDPRSQASVEAHISLTVPFQKEPDDRLWSELVRVASGFTPFTIRYGPLVPSFRSEALHSKLNRKMSSTVFAARWRSAKYSKVRVRASIRTGRT